MIPAPSTPGERSDGIQWDGDDDLGTTDDTIPQEGCHPGESCWQSCNHGVARADADGPAGVGAGRTGSHVVAQRRALQHWCAVGLLSSLRSFSSPAASRISIPSSCALRSLLPGSSPATR